MNDSVGWCEPFRVKYMCDKKSNKEGFNTHDIAAILVEDSGTPHTIHLCRMCYTLGLAERDASMATNARWKTMFGHKGSRGKLSAALEPDGFLDRMLEKFAAKKLQATTAEQLGTSWQDESPYKE